VPFLLLSFKKKTTPPQLIEAGCDCYYLLAIFLLMLARIFPLYILLVK